MTDQLKLIDTLGDVWGDVLELKYKMMYDGADSKYIDKMDAICKKIRAILRENSSI